MVLDEITLRRLHLPLTRPYKRSYRVDHHFEPFVVEVRDRDGRSGWGEAIIASGYTHETPDGGWDYLEEVLADAVGLTPDAAKAHLLGGLGTHPNAVSLAVSAMEMLEDDPRLRVEADARVPLLAGLSAETPEAARREVADALARGFTTVKVKVGFDVDRDLARVAAVQEAVQGRALVRLDANRGYGPKDGARFAAALEPDGIMLFEQPCEADDWEGTAAVARVSRVPVMLDESIYDVGDIDRAAAIDGVGFVKVKLKKMGGVERLEAALERIRSRGLKAVLGDGVATEISCWMEACIARLTLDNAGEMNGFLRVRERLFENPLPFEDGAILFPAGYRPRIDRAVVDRLTERSRRFTPTRVAAGRTGSPSITR